MNWLDLTALTAALVVCVIALFFLLTYLIPVF